MRLAGTQNCACKDTRVAQIQFASRKLNWFNKLRFIQTNKSNFIGDFPSAPPIIFTHTKQKFSLMPPWSLWARLNVLHRNNTRIKWNVFYMRACVCVLELRGVHEHFVSQFQLPTDSRGDASLPSTTMCMTYTKHFQLMIWWYSNGIANRRTCFDCYQIALINYWYVCSVQHAWVSIEECLLIPCISHLLTVGAFIDIRDCYQQL